MATEQDYKIIRVEEGSITEAVNNFNNEANSRYFPIQILEDSSDEDATSVLLSQGVNVLQGRHPDIANVHFVTENGTTDELYVLVDLDDLTNYPHFNTDALDLEAMRINIDASTNASYIVEIGFLRNVNATDAEFVEVFRTSAENSDGATVHSGRVFEGGGGILKDGKWLSSKNPTSTDLANTELVASTIDPDTANVTPADGDLVMRITRGNTDLVSVAITITYRSI